MTEIKICGLTRTEDVDAAVASGATMIGLVFASQSPRLITTDIARRLVGRVPDEVKVVGVFMNQPASEVAAIVAEITLDVLQFHGEETNAYCKQFGLPFFKAISMHQPADLDLAAAGYPDAQALLLDSHGHGEAGGQGRLFNWSAIGEGLDVPLVLAGGLLPANVSDAVQMVQPWAVDVSSGVEMGPGIKDHELMEKFCEQVGTSQNNEQ